MPARAESVKDSFDRLDLVPDGFRVLFDAFWVARDAPSAESALDWTAVESPAGLDDWTTAAGLPGIIRPAVLADPAVRIFAARHSARGPIIGGATANATGRVVGVSNVFYDPPVAPTVWHDVPGILATAFPGRRIVGYAHGDQLAHAIDSGFSPLHPLRVWHRQPAWPRQPRANMVDRAREDRGRPRGIDALPPSTTLARLQSLLSGEHFAPPGALSHLKRTTSFAGGSSRGDRS